MAGYFQGKVCEVEEGFPLRVAAYQQCLELMLQYDVYQVMVDTSHCRAHSQRLLPVQAAEDVNSTDQKQTKYFRGLVDIMMRSLQPRWDYFLHLILSQVPPSLSPSSAPLSLLIPVVCVSSSAGLWCGCVCAMLRLHHLLVEPWLPLLCALLPSLQPHSVSSAWYMVCVCVSCWCVYVCTFRLS